MGRRLRKLVFTTHLTFSVGWLGAAVAYIALAVATVTSGDVHTVRSSYQAMELVGWKVIVPMSLVSLLAGLVQATGTQWGLFRYWWVIAKLVLTLVATAVLLAHMPTISRMAESVINGSSASAFGAQRFQPLLHAIGGVVVLLVATVLSVYKPWGRRTA